MNFKEFCLINEVQQIGYQDVENLKLFGPVYHGTTEDNRENILNTGFKINVGLPRSADVRHGYEAGTYGNTDTYPPIHHLGFGIYFTTNKSIAKSYNLGSSRGLQSFYLNVPRLETINFGAPNTMMKWWQKNGYNMPTVAQLHDKTTSEIQQIWLQATNNLTDTLKAKYDAVWFKGKGLRRLLDGDQICVFDTERIFLLNTDLNEQDKFLVGDRVKVKNLPVAVKILGVRQANIRANPWDGILKSQSNFYYTVKLEQKDASKIAEFYKPQLLDFMMHDPEFQSFANLRMQNSGESKEISLSKYVDYLTSKSSLALNFPESLLDKKLKKGERI